jgi:hypothetical protein
MQSHLQRLREFESPPTAVPSGEAPSMQRTPASVWLNALPGLPSFVRRDVSSLPSFQSSFQASFQP